MDNNAGNNSIVNLGMLLDMRKDVYVYDFISGKQENYELSKKEVQARLTGMQRQIGSHIVLSSLFIRNLYMIIKTLRIHPNSLSGWCCLLVSLLGIVLNLYTVCLGLADDISCRPLVLYITCAISLSNIFNTIILLHKAYLALLRPYWIAISGLLFIALQFAAMIDVVLTTKVTMEEYYGCVFNYDNLVPYIYLASIVPVNAFFSAIFSYVVYKQYKTFGSDAWKRLAKDGIQAMCLVVLCNIVCTVLIIFRVLKTFSDLFFIIDWVFTSTILVNHCAKMTKTVDLMVNTSNKSRDPNSMQMDIKATITTYQGRIRGTTNLTSLF